MGDVKYTLTTSLKEFLQRSLSTAADFKATILHACMRAGLRSVELLPVEKIL